MGNVTSRFERGFGKYNKVVVVNNTTKKFDVSPDFGAAAIMVEDSTTGTATLINGGEINLAKLAKEVVYEFGIAEITVSNTKDVYVLFR